MRVLNAQGLALKARAVAGERIDMPLLVFVDLPATPQRWALGGTPVAWGGYTWVDQDLQAEAIEDDAGQPAGTQLTLPGVTEQQLALAVDGDIEGSQQRIYLALQDPVSAEVADAMQVWAGELDIPGWQHGTQSLVHLTAEHRATVAARPRVSRYTDDEQQRLYPGDTSLAFDPGTDAAPMVWPNASFFKVRE
jgi:hypothetical protein